MVVQGTLGLEHPLAFAAGWALLHVGVDPLSELHQNLVAKLHVSVGLKEELLFLDDVFQPASLGLKDGLGERVPLAPIRILFLRILRSLGFRLPLCLALV